jgi:hypothetical protein
MENIIWFNYEYKTSKEILDFIFLNISKIDYLIYIFLSLFLIVVIFYIWPKFLIYKEKKENTRRILMKKKMLHRMKIQRDVEDEIEKELMSK